MLLRAAWSSCSPSPSPLWIHSMYKSADLVVWCLAGAFRCHPSAPEGVHRLPQLSIHFPQCFVGFFSWLTFSWISFTSCSALAFLFWLGQVQTLLLFPCLYLLMYHIMSSFSLFWVTPGSSHLLINFIFHTKWARVYSLPSPLEYMLFPGSWLVFFSQHSLEFF